MEQPNLINLLEKYHKGLLSTEEKALLNDWFKSQEKNYIPDQLTTEDKIEIKNNLLAFIDRDKDKPVLTSEDTSLKERRTIPYYLYRIAASLLLVAFVGYASYNYYQIKQTEKYAVVEVTSAKTIQKILLSDGSIVWLKPNSSLSYPKNFKSEGERMVSLRGEALFEVEKKPKQPFIVHSGELTTTVLGTSFNIKTVNNKIEVVVLTGKVSLTSTVSQQHIIVLPDQHAVYNRSTNELIKIETPVEQPIAKAIVKDTEYNMDFNDTRMDEIGRRIEGKFNVKVIMENSAIGNCVITADFTDQSLTKTLDIIKEALTMEYELKGQSVILRGNGCK